MKREKNEKIFEITFEFILFFHCQVIVTVPQIFEKMLVNVHDAADFNMNLGYVILVRN